MLSLTMRLAGAVNASVASFVSPALMKLMILQKSHPHISHNEALIFERSQTGRIGYRLPPLDVEETPIDEDRAANSFDATMTWKVLPEVSEVDVIRHFTRMSTWNYSIDLGMYPARLVHHEIQFALE